MFYGDVLVKGGEGREKERREMIVRGVLWVVVRLL